MSRDARFEDGAEAPLRLVARDAEDLKVIATLAQDAVFTGADISWQRRARRVSILINRFRWEDRAAAKAQGRPPERVRSLLVIAEAGRAMAQGLQAGDSDQVYSLLDVAFEAEADNAGRVVLTLAGDGDFAVVVEALEVSLCDVTRPYAAPSGRIPGHPD